MSITVLDRLPPAGNGTGTEDTGSSTTGTEAGGTARLVVSVHDVAPATADVTRRWMFCMESFGVPATLLVVPGPWQGRPLSADRALVNDLRRWAWCGHETALHGWEHTLDATGAPLRRTVAGALSRGCAEFAVLDRTEARRRIDLGLRAFEQAGLRADGFTPPGWLISRAARGALAEAGLRYTTDHRGVLDLRTGRRLASPALSHRPGGLGEGIASRALAGWSRRIASRGGVVRIALHPDDFDRDDLRRTTLETIAAILAAGVRPVTYATLVGADTDPAGAPADAPPPARTASPAPVAQWPSPETGQSLADRPGGAAAHPVGRV